MTLAKDRHPYPPMRAWFWPTRDLTHRWRPIQRGGDEWDRPTIGIRVPRGIWWIALGRPKDCDHPDAWPSGCDWCERSHLICPECTGPLDACPGYQLNYVEELAD